MIIFISTNQSSFNLDLLDWLFAMKLKCHASFVGLTAYNMHIISLPVSKINLRRNNISMFIAEKVDHQPGVVVHQRPISLGWGKFLIKRVFVQRALTI